MASAVIALPSSYLNTAMSPAPANRLGRQSFDRENATSKGDAVGDDRGKISTEESGGDGGGIRDGNGGQSERRRRKSSSEGTVVRKKVGGYILGDVIGEGSFAKVRLGTHVLTQEQVAVKVIDKKLIANREYVRKNLRREATVLQKMRHTNIARLYEVLETASNYYLVMELAEGGTFMSFLCKRRKLSERETRRYIRQLVTAVDHMHHLDVIHRDIKIENFLLDNDQNLKVIDFGLSNILGYDGLLRTQCGSPAYAAPEIFCNSSYGPAVDIWSVGVNMYAMLTGELPFVVDPPNNMSKLHTRIMQGANVPDTLTKDCRDLLRRLIEPKEQDRIKLADVMRHPWMNRGYSRRLYPSRFEDTTPRTVVDQRIIKALVQCGHHEDVLTECVQENRPTPENAAYCLLAKRIAMGWGYPESNYGNAVAVDNDRSEMVSVLTGMGGDDAMEAEHEGMPSPVLALRRPISGRGTRSMAAKEQNFEMESKLKSDRLKLESMNSPIEKTPKTQHASPTKREIQDDMRKAWNKLQTNSKSSDDNTRDSSKNNSVKSSNSEGSDMNSAENKMGVVDAPKSTAKNVRKMADNKTTSQLPRRAHNSFSAKPSTVPRPNFAPALPNNTCIFIVNGKIKAADHMVGRSAGRNSAHISGKRHSFHGGEKMIYTKRGLERAKTVPAVHIIESSVIKNGTDEPATNDTDKETRMDTQVGQINVPYQPHNAFPIHRLGNGITLPSQIHRHSSRYLPGGVSSSVTSATHHHQYAQHLQYHGNRHQSLRRSLPHHHQHHQRSLTAPQAPGRSQSPLPLPPQFSQPSKEEKVSASSPAKAVAWQDPPATVLPTNGPPRSIRNRQRELPNIKGFVGYM